MLEWSTRQYINPSDNEHSIYFDLDSLAGYPRNGGQHDASSLLHFLGIGELNQCQKEVFQKSYKQPIKQYRMTRVGSCVSPLIESPDPLGVYRIQYLDKMFENQLQNPKFKFMQQVNS